jgi:DNA recombination protein RmuC
MTLDLISLLLGGVLGAVIGGMLVYMRRSKDSGFDEHTKEQLLLAFKSLSNEALDETTKRFLQVAEENLKGHHQKAESDLDKRRTAIEEMLKPVGKSLDDFNRKITDFDKNHAGIHGEVKSLLSGLQQETKSLVEVLKTPPLRGNWGEVQLKRILEASGMVEQVNYRTQVTVENARPDIVVDMPGGGAIVIDSKAPMKAYFDALADGITQSEQKAFIAQHVEHVRKHVKELSSKAYWDKFDSPEFVVMFFPSESALRLAQESDPNLTHDAFQKNVLMASPLTLLGLLRVVSFGWRQVQMADNARKVSELGADLYRRIQIFAGHFQKVGNGLRTALGAYDSAVGSLERQLLSGARKFKDLHVVDMTADEKHIDPIGEDPRRITVEELDEDKHAEGVN